MKIFKIKDDASTNVSIFLSEQEALSLIRTLSFQIEDLDKDSKNCVAYKEYVLENKNTNSHISFHVLDEKTHLSMDKIKISSSTPPPISLNQEHQINDPYFREYVK